MAIYSVKNLNLYKLFVIKKGVNHEKLKSSKQKIIYAFTRRNAYIRCI